MAKIYVPPYVKVVDGDLVHVDGYFRESGSNTVVDPYTARTNPSPQNLPAPPGENMRPSDAIDFVDQRKSGPPIAIDYDAMDAALEAAGVQVTPNTKIKLRLRDAYKAQGSTLKLGPDEYRVVVLALDKPKLKDRHLYVINNSLVHELRHVHQMQNGEHYDKPVKTFNDYWNQGMEVEGRYWGRLADVTGKKDTGPAGKALGKKVWGLVPAEQVQPATEAPDAFPEQETLSDQAWKDLVNQQLPGFAATDWKVGEGWAEGYLNGQEVIVSLWKDKDGQYHADVDPIDMSNSELGPPPTSNPWLEQVWIALAHGKPRAVIFDIDSTLSSAAHRSYLLEPPMKDWPRFHGSMVLDQPIPHTVARVREHKEAGDKILVLSMRPERFRQVTKDWLKVHDIPFDELWLRPENDKRPGVQMKEKIYREDLAPRYDVQTAYDDRQDMTDMWAANGIPTARTVSDPKLPPYEGLPVPDPKYKRPVLVGRPATVPPRPGAEQRQGRNNVRRGDKIYVPPHPSVTKDGKPVEVSGYWRRYSSVQRLRDMLGL